MVIPQILQVNVLFNIRKKVSVRKKINLEPLFIQYSNRDYIEVNLKDETTR